VTPQYRLGIQIVLATVLISAVACMAKFGRESSGPARAGQDVDPEVYPLGEFELLERSGRTVNQTDLANQVWIASFIFTRCPLSCPRISSVMKSLQSRLEGTNVLLVSVSVDPEHDTPAVLAEYARRFGASADGWWFLTGPKSTIKDLVQNRFKLSLVESTAEDRASGAEAISHSDRLALVDRGRLVGFFESDDPAALDSLVARARHRAQPPWVRTLPSVNASLNALCAVLLMAGWIMIRHRQLIKPGTAAWIETAEMGSRLLSQAAVRAHVVCMVLAVLTSTLFLGSYLVYHYHAGSVAFRNGGPLRLVYFTILLSHTVLATFGVVPLVVLTIARAVRRNFARHSRIAQITFPIWLYVSITGVVIYLMLYHLPVSASSALINGSASSCYLNSRCGIEIPGSWFHVSAEILRQISND
jgi:protein SCO1